MLGKGNVQQNLDVALNFFENAIQKDPSKTKLQYLCNIDLAAAYHYKGRVNQCKGDFARAIPDFTMAIKLDSSPNSSAESKTIAEHWNYCG